MYTYSLIYIYTYIYTDATAFSCYGFIPDSTIDVFAFIFFTIFLSLFLLRVIAYASLSLSLSLSLSSLKSLKNTITSVLALE